MTEPIVNNYYTKLQIKRWLDKAVKKAQDQNPREKLRRLRQEKMKKVAKGFGF